MSDQALTLTRLTAPDEVSGFLCQDGNGACDLEEFLKNDALDYEHTKNISRTYLGWQAEQLVGFFTLSCGSFKFRHPEGTEMQAAAGLEGISFALPAIVLARIAVDDRWRSHGFGADLFKWAVHIARERVAVHAGCRYLFIDAYAHLQSWYQNLGCQPVGKPKGTPSTPKVYMAFDLFQ